MYKDKLGQNILEIDDQLAKLTNKDCELKVTEKEFLNAIRPYKLCEALEQFAVISKKIFDNAYPEDWHRLSRGGIRHPSGIFLTQFSIEYITSAFILSGSNDWKNKSIKEKDNILGVFNLYQNGLIQAISAKPGITSLLVPMSFQQFISQLDPKDVFTRQWYIFCKIRERLGNNNFDDINEVFLNETGITISEYTKLCILIFATIITYPRFNIGELSQTKIKGLDDVFNKEKLDAFLDLISTDYSGFRKLDNEINSDLDPKYTKTRFNPLWLKPVIKIKTDDYIAPCITAYTTSTFKGLFWWFDNYFRKQSKKKADDFRSYFGNLFEEYVGDIIKDTYGTENVLPQIKYGSKKNNSLFFDWIVEKEDKVLCFEVKGYQFPLEVLQKGDEEKINKEIVNKLVKTIIQMYKRTKDIDDYDELKSFRNKNSFPIAIFYDIPLISTPMYKDKIIEVLNELESKYIGIKDFEYYFIGIEELEDFCYTSDKADIEILLKEANNNHTTGFRMELDKINKNKELLKKNLLDKSFDEYCSDVIGLDPKNKG